MIFPKHEKIPISKLTIYSAAITSKLFISNSHSSAEQITKDGLFTFCNTVLGKTQRYGIKLKTCVWKANYWSPKYKAYFYWFYETRSNTLIIIPASRSGMFVSSATTEVSLQWFADLVQHLLNSSFCFCITKGNASYLFLRKL